MLHTARIEVQNPFCHDCSIYIKKKLQEIDEINNIWLYPKVSLITFSFNKINKLSTALNILSDIGYHEKGELICEEQFSEFVCNCEKIQS